MRITVCHISTLHDRNDIRIFHKECLSLSNHGYKVCFVVADSLGDDNKNNISIFDIGLIDCSRLLRMLISSLRMLRKVYLINPDVCHFHDPELLPVGLFFKILGKKVLYDVHEDLPRQILSKEWLPRIIRPALAFFIEIFEDISAKFFDGIVTATPHINDRFIKNNRKTVNINNFPLIKDIMFSTPDVNTNRSICYIGGITRIRGLLHLMDGLQLSMGKLMLAGDLSDKKFEMELKSHPAWEKVSYFGSVPREQISHILSDCIAGVVTFLPEPNHVHSQPNKMFEYMAAGLPVICSNFPLWNDIIIGNNCGVCVNPLNPLDIARAINFLIENKDVARQLGINGYRAVREKYNWDVEEKKLLRLYKKIL